MDVLAGLVGANAALIGVAVLLVVGLFLAVRIVPQSDKFVIERFGKLRAVLGPGILVDPGAAAGGVEGGCEGEGHGRGPVVVQMVMPSHAFGHWG